VHCGPEPQRLKCNLTPELTQSINAAYKHNLEPIANLELTMVELEEWGKGFVEKARCRPDALAQLAMQLA